MKEPNCLSVDSLLPINNKAIGEETAKIYKENKKVRDLAIKDKEIFIKLTLK